MSDAVDTSEGRSTTTGRAWAILAAMGFGALIAQMFSTVVGPALPTIKDDLDLSLSTQTWTITAYSLAFGTALIAGGRLGDLVGEVRMIVIGFAIFAVGLVMSALALDGLIMIGGRAVQGIGIGISAPATLSIVVNSFPLRRRGLAVGIWGFAHGFGMLIGPIFAGYLLELLTWRWVFWLAVPLTGAVIAVTIVATRGYRSVLAGGTYDVVGLLVGGAGITLVTFGLQNASNGWALVGTWATIAAGAVLLAAFGILETRIAHPLVDFSLWRERLFSGAFFSQSAVSFVYIPMLTFVGALYFIDVLGMSPVLAGWVIAITTGTCMLCEPLAGRWVDVIGPGIPITVALSLQAVALFWMGTFTPETTIAAMVVPLALMGVGVGIALPASNTAGMSAVDARRAGMGSGLMQATFNIPAALGVAVVTSIIGTWTLGRVETVLADRPFLADAVTYANAVENGDDHGAAAVLARLPARSASLVEQAVRNAQSASITTSMVILGFVVAAGAVMAAIVIGRRRIPDGVVVPAGDSPAPA